MQTVTIKLLADYSGAELEALTEEQAQRLVDLECAEAGIPFAPDPPAPYTPLKAEHDVKLYHIGDTKLYLRDRGEAEDVARFLRAFSFWDHTYNWSVGGELIAQPSTDQFEVSGVDAYSLKKMEEQKDARAKDAQLKKAHEKATENYTKVCERRSKIAGEVWDVIWDAWRFAQERRELQAQLERCIKLAEGNVAIGLRFFEKAHPGYQKYFQAGVIGFGELSIDVVYFRNPDSLEGSL